MKKFAFLLFSLNLIFAETIKIGMETTYPPFAFISGDTKKPAGFEVDLAAELSKRIGFDFEIVEGEYKEICSKINNGELDIGISSFGEDESTEDCDRSVAYYQAKILFVKLQGRDDIATKSDLNGKMVVFDNDLDDAYDILNELNATLNPIPTSSIMTSLYMLNEKKADAILMEDITKGILIDGYPYLGQKEKLIVEQSKELGMEFVKTEIFHVEDTLDDIFIIFPQNGRLKELKDKINAEIAKMRNDGTITKMLNKYEY